MNSTRKNLNYAFSPHEHPQTVYDSTTTKAKESQALQYHLRGMTQLKSDNEMSLISYNATPNYEKEIILDPTN